MPIEVAKNINTMLKEVSINEKKIKDKNYSVIVEHDVIQVKNRRILPRQTIFLFYTFQFWQVPKFLCVLRFLSVSSLYILNTH